MCLFVKLKGELNMVKKSSRRLYAALTFASLSAATLTPGGETEAAPKVLEVRGNELQKNKDFDYPMEIISPSEPLVFKQGKPALHILKQEVRFASGTYVKPVRWSGIDTSEVGEFVATATYTNRGKTITVEVPYKVEGYKLSLMHTNDTHAALKYAPNRATAVKQVRAKNPDTLLIDAGDVFSGSLYFNEFKGQADLKLMNYMKYDLMVPGNHEFDLGEADGNDELADFVSYANFPFVSSNVDYSSDQYMDSLFRDQTTAKPYNGRLYEGVIKVVDGKKIGFFGLTTEETATISSPGPVQFQNYIEEAKKAVATFEEMGVHQIVAVTHIGFNDNPTVDNDLLLAEHVDGIDVIVGGHSHTRLTAPVVITEGKTEPTVIVQADQYSQFLGTLDVEFDKDGKIIKHAGSLIDVRGLQPDPYAVNLLAPFKEVVDKISNDPIGVSLLAPLENPRDEGDVNAPSVRKNETPLGNLITDGMFEKALEYDANVIGAVQNGGGIRAAIDAGDVTTGEVLTTLPFGNTLAVMNLKGSELLAAFERSVSVYPIESGGFLHVSGFKVLFDSSKPAGERIVEVTYDGDKKIDPNSMYKVATNYYTAQGGDNYQEFKAAFEDARVTDLGLIDWENFRDHLISLGNNIDPQVEGRIVDVNVTP